LNRESAANDPAAALEPSSAALNAIHRQLLDQLPRLDRLGEHIAAAHLAAAIDALEDRLELAERDRSQRLGPDPMDVMATKMFERLGDRAAAVSRAQMSDATGQTLLVWASITSRLDQMIG
jgi:hypothetical protein